MKGFYVIETNVAYTATDRPASFFKNTVNDS